MISRQHRFHGYNSLRFAYRNGRPARGPLFSVTAALNPRRQSYRAAVVVSRKVNKSAIKRNRIRRRLYELIRLREKSISQPFDIIITVFHDSVIDEPITKLQDQVNKQLTEAGVFRS